MNAVPVQHQRVDGAARIGFKVAESGATELGGLYQRAPCRVLLPAREEGDLLQAVVLTTCGGLTGGDRTRLTIEACAGAQAIVTTQAAERVYRALPGAAPADVVVEISAAADSWLEWLAQETILFDGARLHRSLRAQLSAGAELLATESIVFGRTAMGEGFDRGYLHDAWRIEYDGRVQWIDALHLDGDVSAQRALPFSFGTAVACCTVVYAGANAAQLVTIVRRELGSNGMNGGATVLGAVLLVRMLSDDAAALRLAVVALIGMIRHAAAGLPQRVPRVWHC